MTTSDPTLDRVNHEIYLEVLIDLIISRVRQCHSQHYLLYRFKGSYEEWDHQDETTRGTNRNDQDHYTH
jgi:hypothetical protein